MSVTITASNTVIINGKIYGAIQGQSQNGTVWQNPSACHVKTRIFIADGESLEINLPPYVDGKPNQSLANHVQRYRQFEGTKTTAKYRFDDAYESVYELSADGGSYGYIDSYHTMKITAGMSEAQKINRVDEYQHVQLLNDNE